MTVHHVNPRHDAAFAELLQDARVRAELLYHRVQLQIPSILAEGETFALRISATGADGLPLESLPVDFRFEDCVGVEGLPDGFRLEAGAARIDGLRAVGPEAVVIRARGAATEAIGVKTMLSSNPAWVFPDPPYRIYWGDLHVHTRFSDCSGWRCLDPEWCYRYARDVSLLDFAAPADHLRGIAADPARWPRLQALARAFNQSGAFVSWLAFESSHAQGYGGDNNAYFLDDDAPYFWLDRDDMRGNAPAVPLETMWEQLETNGHPFFTVPHHTGRGAKYRAWHEPRYHPSHEPLFEIYSSWGSSEMRCTRMPISGGNNDDASYFVDALRAGARFGVIASSDDHATLPGSVHHFRTMPYHIPMQSGYAHKGLAAVRSPRLTRADLFAAMRRRDVYATTHPRSLVDLRIGDAGMGQEAPADSALRQRREIRLRFTLHEAGTAAVTLMRNGEALEGRALRGACVSEGANEMIFTDEAPLEKIAVRDARFHPEPFAVYYARIEDSNGAHQWTSPIWIDGA